MIGLIAFSLIFLVLLSLLVWMARSQFVGRGNGEMLARVPVEFLIPRKSDEFAIAQRQLGEIQFDIAHKQRLSIAERERLLQQRNKLVQQLLTELRDDFVRLDQLMCAIAVVSPEVSQRKEFTRFWLSVRFALRYKLTCLILSLGALPTGSIRSLGLLIANRSRNLEALLRSVDSQFLMRVNSGRVN